MKFVLKGQKKMVRFLHQLTSFKTFSLAYRRKKIQTLEIVNAQTMFINLNQYDKWLKYSMFVLKLGPKSHLRHNIIVGFFKKYYLIIYKFHCLIFPHCRKMWVFFYPVYGYFKSCINAIKFWLRPYAFNDIGPCLTKNLLSFLRSSH